ncbi:hypothetical protein [Actinokineospora enzanensis]|uniref:hypothetical protein n=1 Tax=Actinokineospora enzanensis TaxID=155975 RepID=UPI0012EBC555|nr:hypothetical protein [Actinokineospora enzanensis]
MGDGQGGAVVACLGVVGFSFLVSALAFLDDAGVASVASWWVTALEYLGDGVGRGRVECFGRKGRLVGDLAADGLERADEGQAVDVDVI